MAAAATLHRQSPVPPTRSPTQREEALAKANAVRNYRSAYKRQIRVGSLNLIDELEGPVYADPQLAGMKVADLLPAVPRVGPFRVGRILGSARISYCKTLDGLTPRQRDELLAQTILHIPHAEATR
jgi:hypothetical protein